jgi:hypothetical protein
VTSELPVIRPELKYLGLQLIVSDNGAAKPMLNVAGDVGLET